MSKVFLGRISVLSKGGLYYLHKSIIYLIGSHLFLFCPVEGLELITLLIRIKIRGDRGHIWKWSICEGPSFRGGVKISNNCEYISLIKSIVSRTKKANYQLMWSNNILVSNVTNIVGVLSPWSIRFKFLLVLSCALYSFMNPTCSDLIGKGKLGTALMLIF